MNAGSAAIDLANRIPFGGQVLKRTADGAGKENAETIRPDLHPLSKVPEAQFGFRAGYEGGALIYAGAIALVAMAYFFTKASHTYLFWTAFILTLPLGATLGDLLTKPTANSALNLSRYMSSAAIAVFMVIYILLFNQRAGEHPGA